MLITMAGSGKQPLAVMRSQVKALLKSAEKHGRLPDVARSLIDQIGIEQFLPEPYRKFQPVVLDSLVFILSELSSTRLADKIVDQIRLPRTVTAGIRMTTLIKDMPTIQKLGQVISRSPGLDPIFREALIDLEDNLHTVTYAQIRRTLQKQTRQMSVHGKIKPEDRILAEATVCVVIPSEVQMKGQSAVTQSVLKIVKPSVRKSLKRDMALWDKLTVFLDQNKERWGMRDFDFSGSFDQVRWLIDNEVDLIAEQQNLALADQYYQSDPCLLIPEILPVSNPSMTVMSRVEGTKVTHIEGMTPGQRRRLAKIIAKVCILKPLQDLEEISIFHGDPHAGNIAYFFQGRDIRIVFYDWAMMGRLTRLDRFLMALVSTGLILKNPKIVFYAADMITRGQISLDSKIRKAARNFIDAQVGRYDTGPRGILTEIKVLFEELTYLGVTFPVNLMMFEKAVFTLKGVIADIDPEFDQNDYLAWEAMVRFMKDLIGMRFHRVLLEEMWSFYQNHPDGLLEAQKEIVRALFRIGIVGVKHTFSQIRNR